jgi:predicted nucleic acid-binding protein
MIAVIDTSALLRLFIPDGPIPEGLEAFFRGVETGNNTAIAPELLIVESINVVIKKQLRNELSDSEAKALISLLRQMPIRYFSHHPLYERTHQLALESSMTAYDALFLALALERGASFFTADEKLMKEAEKRGLLYSAN